MKLSTLLNSAAQSPVERIASALEILIDSVKAPSRPTAVFAREDSNTTTGSRVAVKMQYRLWRRQDIEAAENLISEVNVSNYPVDLNKICDHLNLFGVYRTGKQQE